MASLSRSGVPCAILKLFVTSFIGVVACGDNARPCDHVETDDVGNDVTAELTGATIGEHGVRVCGAIESGHFDELLDQLDQDTYRVTVATSGPVLVQVFGEAGVALLDDLTVRVFDIAANPRLLAEGHYDPSRGDHGAFLASLDPGDYDVIVSAHARGDVSSPVSYRLRLSPMPACDALTSPVDYTEAHDGAASSGNDMVDVDFTKDPSFTATPSTSDAAEPTHLELVAGEHYLIAGSSASTPSSDQYLDRDTYDIATDDTSNELAIRLDWDGTASDLDYIVFDAATMTPVATANLTSTTVHELAMFAVQPSTRYWLWIGAYHGSAPTSYRATICGGHYYY